MSTYIIGDVQGCFDSLQALLQKINFNPKQDRLGFVGDLVNRGPQSLETLRFISQLHNPLIVLGNHDLHLMALYFLHNHPKFKHIPHTLDDVLTAPDCKQLIDFLLQQPFLIYEEYVLVHAGIPPQWSINTAIQESNAISILMRHDPVLFFQHIYGNQPNQWHGNLSEWDRARYTVNALTRMRFCDANGTLELDNKTDQMNDSRFRPWFEWMNPAYDIYFGHWAALRGKSTNPRVFALDTGCAWGETLTAIRVEDKKRFQVPFKS